MKLLPIILLATALPFTATAKTLSLEPVFDQAAAWQAGQSRKPVIALERLVYAASAKDAERAIIAERLVALLLDPKTSADAKTLIAHDWLPLVGNEQTVNRLAPLLAKDPGLAVSALSRLPESGGLAAIRNALPTLSPDVAAQAIAALGANRDPQSVTAIASCARHKNDRLRTTALQALGMLGTPEAAGVLEAFPQKDHPAWYSAAIQCAGQLQQGQPERAAHLFAAAYRHAASPAEKMAAMPGLQGTSLEQAVTQALNGDDPRLAAHAIHVLTRAPGLADRTALLKSALGSASVMQRELVIDGLAVSEGAKHTELFVRLLSDESDTIRIAAVRAMATANAIAGLDRTVQAIAAASGAEQRAMQQILAGWQDTTGVLDARARTAIRASDVRPAWIDAAVTRQLAGIEKDLLALTRHANVEVRDAAFKGLASRGDPSTVPILLTRLNASKDETEQREIVRTIAGIGRTVSDKTLVITPVLQAIAAAPENVADRLLGLLPSWGSADALQAVQQRLASSDAAARALANWPDPSAIPVIFEALNNQPGAAEQVLLLRGLFRLVKQSDDANAVLTRVQDYLKTPADKRMFLGALGGTDSLDALKTAIAMRQDAAVKTEADLAIQTLSGKLAASQPATVAQLLAAVGLPVPDAAKPYQDRIAQRQKEIVGKAPKGSRLAAYLDCGAVRQTENGVSILPSSGNAYNFDNEAANPLKSVLFGNDVQCAITGLDPARRYLVGFSWWDVDSDKRRQSVHFKTGKKWEVALPSGIPYAIYKGKKTWADVLLPVPEKTASLEVAFRNEAGPNTVVSEIWVMELPREAKKQVAIITGDDFPGHHWRVTAPELKEILEADGTLEVSIVETPMLLASPLLDEWDAVVLHYMNFKNNPDPGPPAWKGLEQYVASGKGLVMVHFGCGAFQAWKEFEKTAGRVWDPKKRGHDRYRKFTVRIAESDHAIVKGLKDFETEDELYTCLTGNTPIDILADAVSEVDKQAHPMGFVNPTVKGRVFHCTLGHDLNAFQAPGARQLYLQATQWAAGSD